MSAMTFIEEFYPVTAQSIAQSGDDKALIRHALQKWTGLLPENLARHKVYLADAELYNEEGEVFLSINYATCGLCIKYIDKTDPFDTLCDACPLNKMLGHSCDEDDDGNDGGIYYEALSDPQIMIDALNRVLNMLE